MSIIEYSFALNDYSAQSCILRLFPRKRKEIEELLTNGNRQRKKIASQIVAESRHLEKLLGKRQGQRSDLLLPVNVNQKFHPEKGVETRDYIAKKIGIGQSQHREMRAIWDKAKDGDEQAERHERRPPWPSRGKSPWC